MMAADVASVLSFVGGAAAAIGGGVAAAWLQSKSQERIEQRRLRHEERIEQRRLRHQERIERQQRRDRAAEVVAEVSELLRDAASRRSLADRLPEEAVRRLSADDHALQPRQRAARQQVILMAIREPSPEVRRLANELERAMFGCFSSASYSLAGRVAGEAGAMLAARAADGEQEYHKAVALLDELVEQL